MGDLVVSGACIPHHRLRRVALHDEATTSMGAEASRAALRGRTGWERGGDV